MARQFSRFRGSAAPYLFIASLFLFPAAAASEPTLTATQLPSVTVTPATLVSYDRPQPTWLSQPVRDSAADQLQRLKIVFIASEALDVHSTLTALREGGSEGNALMKPMTGSAAVFLAVKAAATWVTVRAADRLAKHNRKGAYWLLGASSAALSLIAVRNYTVR